MTNINDIWIDKEGTQWTHESIWEGCEFISSDNPNDYCLYKTEYVGIKENGVQVKLCKGHFDEMRSGSS